MQGFLALFRRAVCVCPGLVCVSLFVLVFYNERAVLKPKWWLYVALFRSAVCVCPRLVCVSLFASKLLQNGWPMRSRTVGSGAKADQNGRF